jgi:signal transduction histidine kinase
MNRRLLLALAVLGAVATVTAALLAAFAHDFLPYEPAEKLMQVATDGLWIATGLLAWHRRPQNRVGPLMTAIGFADLAHFFYWNAALPFTIAELISWFSLPVTMHLFLAFPSGRLSSRFERRFVASLYVATPVLAFVSQLFWDPVGTDCRECPQNLLLVSRSPTLWAINSTIGDAFIAGALLTTVVLVVRRVRKASGPTRHAMAPVLLTASAAAALLVIVVVLDAFGVETEGSLPLWVGDVLYAAVPVAFLVGLLRTRLHRSAVADLVVVLGSLPPPVQIRTAIADTLGDPSLQLAFWLPHEERYVDPDGNPATVGVQPGRAVTILEHDGNRVAALVHDASLLDDPGLIEAVGAAAGLALENVRLQAELRAQLVEVRASRARIVEAGDAERRRLERDLHDGAQQRLLGIRLALQLAKGRLKTGGEVEELLDEADAEVVGALAELRTLARGLHPAILTEDGLAAALAVLARRAPVPVELSVCTERLSSVVEATAYFVSAEALANVAKHAHASRVTLRVTRENGQVVVNVRDDGVGGADCAGAGLRGLRDRVETLDGQLTVDSPIGAGTRVLAAIPCG